MLFVVLEKSNRSENQARVCATESKGIRQSDFDFLLLGFMRHEIHASTTFGGVVEIQGRWCDAIGVGIDSIDRFGKHLRRKFPASTMGQRKP